MKVLKRLSISLQRSLKREPFLLFSYRNLIPRVKTCKWIGDCFIYTNATNRLSYLIGDQSHVINHFDQGIYLLGYLPAHNRIYVADKDMNILSYALALSVVEYQTAIMRGDMEAAEGMLPDIPADQRNRIARFLEAQGECFLAMVDN